jgi:hypothetical protein
MDMMFGDVLFVTLQPVVTYCTPQVRGAVKDLGVRFPCHGWGVESRGHDDVTWLAIFVTERWLMRDSSSTWSMGFFPSGLALELIPKTSKLIIPLLVVR